MILEFVFAQERGFKSSSFQKQWEEFETNRTNLVLKLVCCVLLLRTQRRC